MQSLELSFNAGVPRINLTFTLKNKSSIHQLSEQFNNIVNAKFKKSYYLGFFIKKQVKQTISSFQTSPLHIILKPNKLGKFQLIQDLSFPHKNPLSSSIQAINLAIDFAQFSCTWGTFNSTYLLVARLPQGSQAAIRNVKEAYRTVPIEPSQWPGLVVKLQEPDSFSINTMDCFRLSSGCRVYRTVGNAGAQIM